MNFVPSSQFRSTSSSGLGFFPLIQKKLIKFSEMKLGDWIFHSLARVAGLSISLLLLLILVYLIQGSSLSLSKFGFDFLITKEWDPVRDIYGALPVIYGTVATSFLGLFFSGPISIGIALFLSEVAPVKISQICGVLIEMLAAIPSVVYGLWGIFVLAPWMRNVFQPWVIDTFGFIPIFQGPAYGVGLFTSSLILSIMMIPTISSVTKEVFKTIPLGEKEAALALGSTRWEMMKLSILKSSKSGILGALFLGLGRALGETMAVTMVIGNRAHIPVSLFAPAQTMASVIANEYAEATSDIHLSALCEIGVVLFGVTFLINFFARLIIFKMKRA